MSRDLRIHLRQPRPDDRPVIAPRERSRPRAKRFAPLVTRARLPYEGIVEAAKKKKCDAIFIASHGRRGLARLVLGSVTQKVLTHSEIPVLVFR